MKISELTAELDKGIVRNIYLLYGEESFLIETFAKRILEKALPDGDGGANADKFVGISDKIISDIGDLVSAGSLFTERRVVLLNDFDVNKLKNSADFKAVIEVLSNVCETSCVIIYMTGISFEAAKANAKKLIAHVEGVEKDKKSPITACSIKFTRLNEAQVVDFIKEKAIEKNCIISGDNAKTLSKLCLNNLTLVTSELFKLSAYVNYDGEITREVIDLLTVKQLDSSVFSLATLITSKKGGAALSLLDELIRQGNHPIVILSSLSMTFLDFYKAKLGVQKGERASDIAANFSYPANRTWVVGKAITAVSRLSIEHMRECVVILGDADNALKSSPLDDVIILERAVAKLLMAGDIGGL